MSPFNAIIAGIGTLGTAGLGFVAVAFIVSLIFAPFSVAAGVVFAVSYVAGFFRAIIGGTVTEKSICSGGQIPEPLSPYE